MKKFTIVVLLLLISFSLGWFMQKIVSETSVSELLDTPIIKKENVLELSQYSIENLSKTNIEPGKLTVRELVNKEDNFSEYLFEFEFKPNPLRNNTKKTTGQINIPNGNKPFPLIVMLRGYINQETFTTGNGTRNAARFFAENGFITIAPDFLGYGGSDKEAENIFESRFQTYVTVLSLLKSLSTIEQWNNETIYLWGHSNGGQIALTVLEITGANYPTTLWAPVSKPFPYSVLYYTDESEDRGKLIRRELAKFEQDHDVESFSLTNYLDKINAPLQIHKGTSDEAVPLSWTEELVKKLDDLEKDVTYYKYPDTDHNLRPSWDSAVQRDLEFFRKFLQ